MRWAEAIEREMPEISGVTFFPSRRWASTGRLRQASLRLDDLKFGDHRRKEIKTTSADAKPLAQSGVNRFAIEPETMNIR